MGISLDSLDSALHSVEVKNAAGDALAIDASGVLTVKATAFDIRALTSGTDSVSAVQSGVWNIGTVASITADVNIADGGNSITVDALNLDIRDLTHVSDSTKIGDGVEFLAVNADGSINVEGNLVVDDHADAIAVTKVSVDTTLGGINLVATALANRRVMTIQNLGSQDIFINDTAATVNDIKIPKGSSAEFKFSPLVDIYAITATGTADVRVLEAA